ncbi:phage holin family protein [soil metagenome]
MEANTQGARSGLDDASMAELVKRLGEQTSLLARQEVELAKAELTQKGKRIGIGAGAFGGAGVVGLDAVGALTATFIALLATAVDTWLAALIVTVVYTAVAGVLALTGKKQVEAGTPPAPERAIASTKSDVEQIKTSAKEGRS